MGIDREDVAEWIADWKVGVTIILLVGVGVSVTWLIGCAVAYGIFGLPLAKAKFWGFVSAFILAPGPVATLVRR